MRPLAFVIALGGGLLVTALLADTLETWRVGGRDFTADYVPPPLTGSGVLDPSVRNPGAARPSANPRPTGTQTRRDATYSGEMASAR